MEIHPQIDHIVKLTYKWHSTKAKISHHTYQDTKEAISTYGTPEN